MEYRVYIYESCVLGEEQYAENFYVDIEKFPDCFSYIAERFKEEGGSFQKAEIYYNVSVRKWILQTTIIMH